MEKKTFYYYNGSPLSETEYKDGKKHGAETSYNPDGSVDLSGINMDDRPYEGWFIKSDLIIHEDKVGADRYETKEKRVKYYDGVICE